MHFAGGEAWVAASADAANAHAPTRTQSRVFTAFILPGIDAIRGESYTSAVDPSTAGLVDRHDHELVDDHVGRPRDREQHAVCDILRDERARAFVDRLRLLGVAAKADERELGLDEAGVDGRHADVAPEQVFAQRAREPAY